MRNYRGTSGSHLLQEHKKVIRFDELPHDAIIQKESQPCLPFRLIFTTDLLKSSRRLYLLGGRYKKKYTNIQIALVISRKENIKKIWIFFSPCDITYTYLLLKQKWNSRNSDLNENIF